MTADERPNILADIKRDHAQFFSLHRRFQEELGLSDHDKQVIIWQVGGLGPLVKACECTHWVWAKLSSAAVCVTASWKRCGSRGLDTLSDILTSLQALHRLMCQLHARVN